jgi:hypothetical protein
MIKKVTYFISGGISHGVMSLHAKDGIVVEISNDLLKKFLNEKIDFVYDQIRKYDKVFDWIFTEEEYREKENERMRVYKEILQRELEKQKKL